MNNFKEQVKAIIRAIPKGRVMSYGQVAAIAGSPRAARQVGMILRFSNDGDLPWWRVINNEGRISIKGSLYATPQLQKELLEKEKIAVTADYLINIIKYRWQPPTSLINELKK